MYFNVLDHWKQIDDIAKSESLYVYRVFFTGLTPPLATQLANVLDKKQLISRIVIGKCELNDDELSEILKKLIFKAYELEINSIDISTKPQSLAIILQALTRNKSWFSKDRPVLKGLTLRDTRVEPLASGMSSNMLEISIDIPRIDNDLSKEISKSLGATPNLEKFCLRTASISNRQLISIASGISKLAKMKRFSLNLNKKGSSVDPGDCDSGLASVAQALESLKHLQSIHFANCAMTPLSTSAISHLLEKNTSITDIDLSDNPGIGSEGAQVLANGLSKRKLAYRLELNNVNLGDEGIAAIAMALNPEADKKGLDGFSIYAGSNRIGDQGAKAIANAGLAMKIPTHFDLYENEIGEVGGISIQESLIKNPEFSVAISKNRISRELYGRITHELGHDAQATADAVAYFFKKQMGLLPEQLEAQLENQKKYHQKILEQIGSKSIIEKEEEKVDTETQMSQASTNELPSGTSKSTSSSIPEKEINNLVLRARNAIESSPIHKMVGLKAMKMKIAEFSNACIVDRIREIHGMEPLTGRSLHMIFSGNPGTGKTTVANHLGELLKDLGVLEKGHVVKVGRGDLVAPYIGQTELKTQSKIDEAIGGILFIDEAYSLTEPSKTIHKNDFGKIAVETIMLNMTNLRGNFMVVAAGYTENMREFISSNPGLRSRFPIENEILFEDYSAPELFEIYMNLAKNHNFIVENDAQEAMKKRLETMISNKGEHFGNAREIENIFQSTMAKQSSRIVNSQDYSRKNVEIITVLDLPDFKGYN